MQTHVIGNQLGYSLCSKCPSPPQQQRCVGQNPTVHPTAVPASTSLKVLAGLPSTALSTALSGCHEEKNCWSGRNPVLIQRRFRSCSCVWPGVQYWLSRRSEGKSSLHTSVVQDVIQRLTVLAKNPEKLSSLALPSKNLNQENDSA